jgi:streptogramin lyase
LQLFRINALSGAVSAVAGCLRCYGFRPGRPATQSSVSSVSGLAVDRSGNVLLAEATTGAIWRLTSAGIVTRVATDVCRFPPHSFVCPQAIAPAKSGTIYFDGELDRRVVESLNPETGKITIVAGGGSCRVNRYFFCGNGVLATRAKLAGTGGIAVDSAGNLFLVDDGLVQRVDARTHRITILAGSGKLIGGPIQVRRGQSFPALTTTIEPQALAVARTGAILMSEEGSGAVLELRPGPAIRVSSPQHRVDRQPAAGDR